VCADIDGDDTVEVGQSQLLRPAIREQLPQLIDVARKLREHALQIGPVFLRHPARNAGGTEDIEADALPVGDLQIVPRKEDIEKHLQLAGKAAAAATSVGAATIIGDLRTT